MPDPIKLPEPISGNIRIGWVGTGVMGLSMCRHIINKGYAVTIHSRTKTRAQPLLEAGAAWGDSPREVAEKADVVFTMVGFPVDVREVYFGERGLLNGVKPGTILIDMTTTEPSLAMEINKAAKARSAFTLDAPVSGGDIGARNASLSIMIGGDREVLEFVMPLFNALGRNIIYQGRPGSGQHAKLCNQIVIAGTMIGVCEGLLYGYAAGLDLETMLDSIKGGAAGCWSLDNLAPRMLKRNFDPGFYVEHFIKDMGIALEEARRMEISLPGLALVYQLYICVKALGHGKSGTQALILALERMSDKQIAAGRNH